LRSTNHNQIKIVNARFGSNVETLKQVGYAALEKWNIWNWKWFIWGRAQH